MATSASDRIHLCAAIVAARVHSAGTDICAPRVKPSKKACSPTERRKASTEGKAGLKKLKGLKLSLNNAWR